VYPGTMVSSMLDGACAARTLTRPDKLGHPLPKGEDWNTQHESFLPSPRWSGAGGEGSPKIALRNTCAIAALITLAIASPLAAKEKVPAPKTKLAEYLEKARASAPPVAVTGSLWTAESRFASLATDDKARRVNDLIIIRVLEQTRAEADGNVKSQRTLESDAGIINLFGPVGARSGIANMFSPRSNQLLDGQAQASSNSLLRTSLTGRVVEVLPNGYLVVEAERAIEMNQQHQLLVVRGVVRPADIGPDNGVLSTALSNLEIELKGKGVISDGVRQPNLLTRLMHRVLGF
jgi:flagellar L-ring protein FlgH